MRKFTFKQSKYPHLDGIAPTRALVIGSSGSGKSLMITNLILDVFAHKWERIYIFSKTAKTDHTWEPVDKFIRQTLKVPEEEQAFFEDFDVEALNKIINTQKQIVEYQKSKNMTMLHSIGIIVDDWGGDESVMRGKKGEALKNLFLMGRHYGINVIVSIQKYRLASTVMRTQATLLMYFKARSMVDLESFLEENSALVPGGKKQLMEIYKVATAENYGFLTINMLTKDPTKVFMKNLEAYLVVT
jgi:hypothetical protein